MKPRNPHALPARKRKGGPHKSRPLTLAEREAIDEQLRGTPAGRQLDADRLATLREDRRDRHS